MADIYSQIGILALLLAFSGFFSGAEVALISLTDAKIQGMIKRKRFGAKYVKKLKESPQRMLSAILIGNNIMNVAAASYMTVVMMGFFGSYAVGIATGVMTFLILIFGEITPKSIAAQHNESVAILVGPPIYFLSIILKPILAMLDWLIMLIMRILNLKEVPTQVTEDEIRYMVTAAEQEGSIDQHEKNLIHNVFELDETTVGEILTPKTDMVTIAYTASVGDALKIIATSKHSRIPVYHQEKDFIVGVLNVRDLLEHKKTVRVSTVMSPTHVVPENKRVSDMIRSFQNRREHFSLVVDEHGTMLGLVTLEDALEEIVGEIVDESEPDEPNVKKQGRDWIVKGRTELDEFAERTKLTLPDGEYETVSGFLLEKFGHIPKEGEEIEYKQNKFIVTEVKGHRIQKVTVKKI